MSDNLKLKIILLFLKYVWYNYDGNKIMIVVKKILVKDFNEKFENVCHALYLL